MRVTSAISYLVLPLLGLLCGGWHQPVASQDVPEGSAEAVSEFAQGLELYNAANYSEALPHLYRAYELDNSFVVSLFHAVLCEGNLGSAVPRDSLMDIILSKRDRLSPYYVHRAESYLAKLNGDRDSSIEHARKAAYLAPGTKAWYNLAYDLLPMNRPREARTALMRLDPDKEPMLGWAGYFGVMATADHMLGRHDEELAVVMDGRERFPDYRPLLVRQAEALAALGRLDGLDALFETAATTPPTGAANTVGAIMIVAAAELNAHGYASAGDGIYARAVTWYEGAGDAVSAPVHKTWYTTALMGADRWQDALDVCDEQLAAQPDYTWFHGAAAMAAAKTGDGDRVEAERAWYVGQAPERGPAFLPANMAFFELAEGHVEAGVALLKRAMGQGTAFSLWWHRDPALEDIQDHAAWKEFLRPKG